MSFPEAVVINGHRIPVLRESRSGLWGRTDYFPDKQILVSPKVNDVAARSILFHEMLHMAFHLGGWAHLIPQYEEGLCDYLEYTLLPAWTEVDSEIHESQDS